MVRIVGGEDSRQRVVRIVGDEDSGQRVVRIAVGGW